MGLSNLIVETDCLLAMQALEEGAASLTDHHALLLEIFRLNDCFQLCTFSYVSRLGNQVAHSLARFTWQVTSTPVWWDSCPDFFCQLFG